MTMKIRYQVPEGGYGSDSRYRGDALCIDAGKMSFMDEWLNTKLVCSIVDMPLYGQNASNPALNGSVRWVRRIRTMSR